MKKMLFVFLFIGLFAGCKEKDAIEVIPNYDEIYLPLNKVDSTPQLIEGDEKGLSEKLYAEMKKSASKENFVIDFNLMIDETGRVKKVEVVKSPDEKITSFAVKDFANWLFKPAIKDGKEVKAQYRWYFNLSGDSKSKLDLIGGDFLPEADEMPMPVGGMYAIQSKIVYPEIAKRAGIEGKVIVKAYIDEEGNVIGTEILKGIGTGLNEAAVSAIEKSKFTPGIKDGKPVKVQVVIPILFKLS
jgi:TonB family protein